MRKLTCLLIAVTAILFSINSCKKSSSDEDDKQTTPTCSDGIQNQGETGIDCGGPCPACLNTNTASKVTLGSGSTMAICSDGSAMGWGPFNSVVASQYVNFTPQAITQTGFSNLKEVSCSNILGPGSQMVLKNDGTLWALGNDAYGQTGTG